jgi:class 3 adenylate cyclase
MKFPIAFKLVAFITLLLFSLLVSVAYRSSQRYMEHTSTKTSAANRLLAETRALEVELLLQKYTEKVSLISSLYLRPQSPLGTTSSQDLARRLFKKETDLLSLQIFTGVHDGYRKVGELYNLDDLEKQLISTQQLMQLDLKEPFAMDNVAAGTMTLQRRALAHDLPVITLGMPLLKDPEGRVELMGMANIKMEPFKRSLGTQGEQATYLVTSAGRVISGTKQDAALAGNPLKFAPVLEKALQSFRPTGQLRYHDKSRGRSFNAAFARLSPELIVITESAAASLLQTARALQPEGFFITGMILTFALILVLIFSAALTRPIKLLTGLTAQIAAGNFAAHARKLISSKDEIGQLALALDHMASELHSFKTCVAISSDHHAASRSTITPCEADSMVTLSRESQVCILSHSIHQFSTLSALLPPDEALTVLNDYLGRIFAIIQRNHGSVHQVMGESFLAVWGTEKSSAHDALYLIKSCLEIRLLLYEINHQRASSGQQPLFVGMGAQSAQALCATIEARHEQQPLLISDGIKTVLTMASMTARLGTDLLIGEQLARQVADLFILEEVDHVKTATGKKSIRSFKVKGYLDAKKNNIEVRTPYSDYEVSLNSLDTKKRDPR